MGRSVMEDRGDISGKAKTCRTSLACGTQQRRGWLSREEVSLGKEGVLAGEALVRRS